MGKKISIVFVIDSLRIGGIQNELITLLNQMDYEKYKVTLICFHENDERERLIDSNVLIKHPSRLLNIITATNEEAKKNAATYPLRTLFSLMCKLVGAKKTYKFVFKKIAIPDSFDYAISYSNNITEKGIYFGCNQFVLKNIDAKEKATWLHVDYKAMHLNTQTNIQEYNNFDKIVCVSNAVRKSLLDLHPEYSSKCIVINNIIDKDKVDSLASQNCSYARIDTNVFNITTIGRLDANKNQILCIKIANILKNKGFHFKWWIVGDGPDRKFLEDEIKKLEIEEYVVITGYQENPYSLLKRCNLFVSTSKSESYGLAIVEALYLGIPVLVNHFPASTEIIKNGYNGFITYSEEEMENVLTNLITDKILYKKIVGQCTLVNIDDDIKSFTRVFN